MNEPLFTVLNVQLASVIYLLFAGVELRRVFKIVAYALGTGLFIVFVTWSLAGYVPSFLLNVGVILTIGVSPFFALMFARDDIMPQISALEIIFLNVAAKALIFVAPKVIWVLNPFYFWYPPTDSVMMLWLHNLIMYWPSLVAVVLMRQGAMTNKYLRALLAIWALVIYTILLFGPAIQGVTNFDGSSLLSWVVSLLASLVTVHVVLIVLSLFHLVFGEKDFYDEYEGTNVDFIASRIYVTELSWRLLVASAVGYWLFVRILSHWRADYTELVQIAIMLSAIVLGHFIAPYHLYIEQGVPEKESTK